MQFDGAQQETPSVGLV